MTVSKVSMTLDADVLARLANGSGAVACRHM